MESSVEVDRLRTGIAGAIGLGFVVGGVEVAALAVRLPVPFLAIELLIAAAAALLGMGLVGALLGLFVGVPLHAWMRRSPAPDAVAWHLALVTVLISGWHVWAIGLLLWTESRSAAAFTLSLLPFGLAGVVYYNALYWTRRAEVGRPVALGWIGLSSFLAALLVGAALVWLAIRPVEGTKLDGPSLVLITVDGLRRDAVGVYGGDPTPAIDELGRAGTVYADAVSPEPASGPANASVLSGLHPLRHRKLDDVHALIRAVKTLPEVLSEQGFTTAAFVSADEVASESGLAQGFQTFDDRFVSPWVHVRLFARLEDRAAWRRGADTNAAFLEWLSAHSIRPFFAWIHYADPARALATGGDYRAAVLDVDASVRQVREALDKAGHERTPIVVAGSFGVMRGEHGLTGAVGLYDPAVRVPLIVYVPGYTPSIPRPDAQVRLMDLPATILELMAQEPLLESEGVELTGYGSGRRKVTMSCPLVGRAADGELELGLRNNGVKFIEAPDGSAPQLFDLSKDPGEEHDLSAEQPGIVEQAVGLLSREKAALDGLIHR